MPTEVQGLSFVGSTGRGILLAGGQGGKLGIAAQSRLQRNRGGNGQRDILEGQNGHPLGNICYGVANMVGIRAN